MLNAIVPPATLASVIAWRNEPVPVSLVLVTVKTKGDVTLFPRVDASGAIGPVERVVHNALAKPEANKIDEIDKRATDRVIRSAKART